MRWRTPVMMTDDDKGCSKPAALVRRRTHPWGSRSNLGSSPVEGPLGVSIRATTIARWAGSLLRMHRCAVVERLARSVGQRGAYVGGASDKGQGLRGLPEGCNSPKVHGSSPFSFYEGEDKSNEP